MITQNLMQHSEPSMDVSFLMTAYNFAPYIAEAVQSLLAMDTALSYEIIVLDDASNDDTWEILKSILDKRLRIIRHENNQGAAVAINTLFMHARGRFIARFDGDDRWHRNFLSSTIPLLESSDSIGLVYGDVAIINEQGIVTSPKGNLNRPKIPMVGGELLPLLETSYICAPAVIAKRQAWEAVLPWPIRSGPGDWLGHLKMANAGWQFAYTEDVVADYRLHGQGMHVTYMQSTQGEKSINKILDEVFSSIGNKVCARQARQIRARHHQRLAFAYISQSRFSDARRLLFSAVSNRPSLLLEKTVSIQFLALLIGYKNYLGLKKLFRHEPMPLGK